jgi:hypothetical protein
MRIPNLGILAALSMGSLAATPALEHVRPQPNPKPRAKTYARTRRRNFGSSRYIPHHGDNVRYITDSSGNIKRIRPPKRVV